MYASSSCQKYKLADVLHLVYISQLYLAVRSTNYNWSTAWIGTRLKTRKITAEIFAVCEAIEIVLHSMSTETSKPQSNHFHNFKSLYFSQILDGVDQKLGPPRSFQLLVQICHSVADF